MCYKIDVSESSTVSPGWCGSSEIFIAEYNLRKEVLVWLSVSTRQTQGTGWAACEMGVNEKWSPPSVSCRSISLIQGIMSLLFTFHHHYQTVWAQRNSTQSRRPWWSLMPVTDPMQSKTSSQSIPKRSNDIQITPAHGIHCESTSIKAPTTRLLVQSIVLCIPLLKSVFQCFTCAYCHTELLDLNGMIVPIYVLTTGFTSDLQQKWWP